MSIKPISGAGQNEKVDMTLIYELECWDSADRAKKEKRIMSTTLSVSERSPSPKGRGDKRLRSEGKERRWGKGWLKYHQCGIGLYTEQFRLYPLPWLLRLPWRPAPACLAFGENGRGGKLAAATQKSDFIRAIES